jgi:hypothetical protein
VVRMKFLRCIEGSPCLNCVVSESVGEDRKGVGK